MTLAPWPTADSEIDVRRDTAYWQLYSRACEQRLKLAVDALAKVRDFGAINGGDWAALYSRNSLALIDLPGDGG